MKRPEATAIYMPCLMRILCFIIFVLLLFIHCSLLIDSFID